MALNRAHNVRAADWLSRTHVYIVGDTIFLSGGNPYKALQFIYEMSLSSVFNCPISPSTIALPAFCSNKITWSLFRQSPLGRLPLC